MKNARSKTSIQIQLIISFTSLVAVGLILLMLFQTLFLDNLYEWSKIRTVKSAAAQIAAVFPEEDITEYADYWSVREDCNIVIIDEQGAVVYSRGVNAEALRSAKGGMRAYYDLAVEQGGELFRKVRLELVDHGDVDKPPKANKPGGDKKPPAEASPENSTEAQSVLYATMTQTADGAPRLVLVSSMLTPVDATAQVLQVQLLIAMILLVALAAALAWYMAKKIASPIVQINRSAKGLANGTYCPPQDADYREAAELRQTLTAINTELRKSEKLQRELIANVSHDLRTPLTMIVGYGEAIRDLPGEDSAENIQVVIDEAQRLSKLVNDVLDLSKLQSGVEQFEMTPVSLTALLRSTVERVSTMMQPNGYAIELDIQAELTVSGNEVRLSQIVYNLLLNALAHTGEDRCVRVRQELFDGCVRVSFTDSGDGIPEEELSNIWLRYYQVHSREHCQAMNSGLGLSIVHALVQRHGGVCGVESVLGTGSTFWFELPLL